VHTAQLQLRCDVCTVQQVSSRFRCCALKAIVQLSHALATLA
jgi:hypothetical protein